MDNEKDTGVEAVDRERKAAAEAEEALANKRAANAARKAAERR